MAMYAQRNLGERKQPWGVVACRASALALAILLGCAALATSAEVPPALLFGKHCSGCHTYGKGVKVGPDLKGVTARRSRPWLHDFIHSSQGVVRSNDPVAVQVYRE